MRVKDLELGEWYTSPSSLSDNILGVKVMSTYKTSLTYQEVISKKLGYYKRSDIGTKDLPEAVFIQTPVEDLKNYLPKDHPDYLALSTDPILKNSQLGAIVCMIISYISIWRTVGTAWLPQHRIPEFLTGTCVGTRNV